MTSANSKSLGTCGRSRVSKAEHKIRSVPEFLEKIMELRHAWRKDDLWFRGHRDASYRLQPLAYRGRGYDEAEVRVEFKRLATQYAYEHRPVNDWEWYFLMQHYGAPTRLLDWSDGALLALYFAVRSDDAVKKELDAAVWVLSPAWLNKASWGDSAVALPDRDAQGWLPKSPFAQPSRKPPLAIDPPHIARRISVQRSHFTLFGRDRDGLIALAKRGSQRTRLAKLIIDAGSVGEIRDALFTCGIQETTVYPDLEGLARELRQLWAN